MAGRGKRRRGSVQRVTATESVEAPSSALPAFALLAVAVLLVFGRSVFFSYVAWDDDFNIIRNAVMGEGDLAYFWKHAYYGLYIPLSYTMWSWLAFGQGWPPRPEPYHVANIVLHLINAGLVFALLRRALEKKGEKHAAWGASLFGALLFALHPLQVGAVAWISGGRDVLAVGFALGATWQALYGGARGRWWALLLFVLGLLAKPSILPLPLAIVLWSHFLHGQSWKKAFVHLAPLLIAAVPFYFVAKIDQPTEQFTHWVPAVWQRPWIAWDALMFYVRQFFFPWRLAVDYGRTPAVVWQQGLYLWSLGVGLPVTAAVYVLYRRTTEERREALTRFGGAGLGWALVLVAPVLGLVPYAFQALSTVTDHYLYLPMVGFALLLAALWQRCEQKWVRGVLAVFVAALAVRAAARVGVWQNDEVFFKNWVADNPDSTRGYIGLGAVAYERGNVPAAIDYFSEALRRNPLDPVAAANLGEALNRVSNFQGTLDIVAPKLNDQAFLDMNRTRPYHMGGLYSVVGTAELAQGRLQESYKHYCQAVGLSPGLDWVWQRLHEIAPKIGKVANAPQLECPYTASH